MQSATSAFGRRGGGGRRSAARATAPLAAALITVGDTHQIALVDISATGARLRGNDLPRKGSELFIKVGAIEPFAKVVWSRRNECGVEFATPLPQRDVEVLRREAKLAGFTGMTPEQRQALDDWVIGVAR